MIRSAALFVALTMAALPVIASEVSFGSDSQLSSVAAKGSATDQPEPNSATSPSRREIEWILEHMKGNPFTAKRSDGNYFMFALNDVTYTVYHRLVPPEKGYFQCSFRKYSTYDREMWKRATLYFDTGCDGSLDSVTAVSEGSDALSRVPPTLDQKGLFQVIIEEFKLIAAASHRGYQTNKATQVSSSYERLSMSYQKQILGIHLSNGRMLQRIGDLIESTERVSISESGVQFYFGNWEKDRVTFRVLIENGYYTHCYTRVRKGADSKGTLYFDNDCNGSIDFLQVEDAPMARAGDDYAKLYQAMLEETTLFLEVAERISPKN